MSSCTPGGRKWKFNSLYLNLCYSRLGDSVESLGRDLCVCGGSGWSGGFVEKCDVFRVKNSEILGGFT